MIDVALRAVFQKKLGSWFFIFFEKNDKICYGNEATLNNGISTEMEWLRAERFFPEINKEMIIFFHKLKDTTSDTTSL